MFEIEVQYGRGQFSVNSINESDVEYIPDNILDEVVYEYAAELGDDDNYFTFSLESATGVLHTFHDDYPKIMYHHFWDEDGIPDGGAVVQNESLKTYFIPYFAEAKTFAISDNAGNEVYSIELSKFSGEGKPETSELPRTIEESQKPPKEGQEPFPVIWIFAILLVALVAVMLWQRRE